MLVNPTADCFFIKKYLWFMPSNDLNGCSLSCWENQPVTAVLSANVLAHGTHNHFAHRRNKYSTFFLSHNLLTQYWSPSSNTTWKIIVYRVNLFILCILLLRNESHHCFYFSKWQSLHMGWETRRLDRPHFNLWSKWLSHLKSPILLYLF